MFAVMSLSQFNQRPNTTHWTAVKHVLRYLKGIIEYAITYIRCEHQINGIPDAPDEVQGWSDADWANGSDCRSISGYIFKLGNGPITWASKKQPTIAISTMEAEYMAMGLATQEILWLRRFFEELGIKQTGPTTLNVDNQPAIDLSKDDGAFHRRAKHIDIKHHFVRNHIGTGDLIVQHVPTTDNLADLFTKGARVTWTLYGE